jgi:hypothetical protein
MNCGKDLYVAGMNEPSLQRAQLDPGQVRAPVVIGFHKNGSEILLRSHFNRILACNPEDGQCRLLFEAEGSFPVDFNLELSKIGAGQLSPSFYPEYDKENLKSRLHLDLDAAHSYRMRLSPDRKTLVYAVDSDSDAKKSTVRIHSHSLESGSDKLLATFPGKTNDIYFSPSGNCIAISFWGEKRQTAILQSGKPARSFEEWDVLGWKGEDEVVLVRNEWQKKRLLMAVGDIATGKIRQFYP